ncbi:GGDEF domain-containing protein, partial [Chelatococcus sambhunathii]
MAGSNWLERWARSQRTWVALAVLAPVLMLAVSGAMLLEMRREAWEKARQTAENLLQLVERDIARNFEIIDLSLTRLAEGVGMPSVQGADPQLRQLILFDRAATARDIGVMLALDENGDVTLDSAGFPPRKLNNADRSYFKAHKADPGLGLSISEPLVSRLTGSPIVVLSRRINRPDGSFGGIALASLKLSYFQRLFNRIGLGPEGAINLYRTDGVRLMRYPSVEADIGANIAGSGNFERFLSAPRGAFVATSVRDGVERYYAFSRVGDLPLVLNVALGASDIEAEWRGRAIALGLVLISLCALTAGLALLFGRELKRGGEMQAELARLSRTDSLTGLPNRRCFEEEFTRVFGEAQRFGRPLSLLVVDADHFKRINDRYGHGVGDMVLKGLARCLARSVHRPGDLVARVGGEEFVVLLPETDAAGAARIAERIHEEVALLGVESAGIGQGAITVSVGSVSLPAGTALERAEFYRLADAALYEAKAGGRNQT